MFTVHTRALVAVVDVEAFGAKCCWYCRRLIVSSSSRRYYKTAQRATRMVPQQDHKTPNTRRECLAILRWPFRSSDFVSYGRGSSVRTELSPRGLLAPGHSSFFEKDRPLYLVNAPGRVLNCRTIFAPPGDLRGCYGMCPYPQIFTYFVVHLPLSPRVLTSFTLCVVAPVLIARSSDAHVVRVLVLITASE